MIFLQYFVFLLAGLFFGLLIGVFFFRTDKTWIKLTSFSGGQAAFMGLFLMFYEVFGINPDHKIGLFSVYFSSAILSMVGSVCFFVSHLKNQDSPYVIKFIDIILGYDELINRHYDYRKQQLDKDLNIADIEEKIKDLDERAKKITSQEVKVSEQQAVLDKVISDSPHLCIPLDFKLPVDTHFLKMLPERFSNINDFYHQLTQFTSHFLSDLDETKKVYSDDKILKVYLSGICLYVGECLFNWRDIRIHVRLFNVESMSYEKWIAFYAKEEYEEPLTKIPFNSGMIFHALNSKRSLVKSANLSFHRRAENDHIWEDYITIVFDKFKRGDHPLFSMGISVKNEEAHKEMLYFLSFIKIEQIIQENMRMLNKCLSFSDISNLDAA